MLPCAVPRYAWLGLPQNEAQHKAAAQFSFRLQTHILSTGPPLGNRQKKKPRVAFGSRVTAALSQQPDSDTDKPLAVSSKAPPAALPISSASTDVAGPRTRLKPVLEASKQVTEQQAAVQAFAAQRQAAQAQAQAIAAQQQAAQTMSEARAAAQAIAAQQQAAQTQALAQALLQAEAEAQAQAMTAQLQAAEGLAQARAAAQAVTTQQQAVQIQALAQAQAQAQAQAIAAQQQAAQTLSEARNADQAIAAEQQAAETQGQAIDAQQQAAMPHRLTDTKSQGLRTVTVRLQQQAIPVAAAKPLAYDWQAYSNESPEKPGHSQLAGTESVAGKHSQLSWVVVAY